MVESLDGMSCYILLFDTGFALSRSHTNTLQRDNTFIGRERERIETAQAQNA